ncbi:MAG: trans-aconitate 2-methyltransferase [Acidimicrobiia bacterium]
MRLDARIPEPELMEDPDQARAYSEADFAAPHQAVVDDLLRRQPTLTSRLVRAIDLGCGPADVTCRLALALPEAEIVGVDGGPRMLALGQERIERLGLADRVRLQQLYLPASNRARDELGRFELVLSNSLLHHLVDPLVLWATIRDVAADGAIVHVVDLRRPDDDDAVDRLVRQYADGEPPVLVDDFRASLRAAYRQDEVRAQLRECGLAAQLHVEAVGDRHLVVSGAIAR